MKKFQKRLPAGALTAYYPKLFSSLSKQEAKLLRKLLPSAGHGRIAFANSISDKGFRMKKPWAKKKIEENKKRFLKGLLAGPSLDAIEAFSINFQLQKLENAGRLSESNFILFLSEKTREGKKRAIRGFTRVLERIGGKANPFYCAFATHNLDSNDYVLYGKKRRLKWVVPEPMFLNKKIESMRRFFDGEVYLSPFEKMIVRKGSLKTEIRFDKIIDCSSSKLQGHAVSILFSDAKTGKHITGDFFPIEKSFFSKLIAAKNAR